jgi:transcriptional regulator with XRE-family HTH domain
MTGDIRGLRRLAGLTQIETSRDSRVERSRLSLAECGHVALSNEELGAVLRVLRSAIRERVKQYEDILREPRRRD